MNPNELTDQEVSMSMAPYAGPWTKAEAGHLLRRTLFGPTNQQLLDAVSNGMSATVSQLLTTNPIPEPLTYDPGEAVAAFGATWVNSVYPTGTLQIANTDNARAKSLGAWLMLRVNTQGFSISEKMCLFWQNHFAVNDMSDLRGTYNYLMKLRQHSLGNVKQMVKDITIEPAMLVFLNGNTNTLYSPNENYARELLELFTVGKGAQIGPGDYTNYKEEDVAAGAKILTGYIVEGLKSSTMPSPVATFFPVLHDNSTKQLSEHFNFSTVAPNGAQEYADYVDVIFQQTAVANYICTKLYRYFVNYDLTTDVQTNVIPVMAATLINNNYEILPVLQELLESEHFYDVALRGSMIKSPIENVMGMLNATNWTPNFDLATNYEMYLTLYYVAGVMGQYYGSPPNVAGWPAFYQVPAFSRLWTNSSTIKLRFDHSTYVSVFSGYPVNGNDLKLDSLTFYSGLSLPEDPVVAIDDMCDVFFPKAVSDAKKLALKNLLTNGLSDAAFTTQYLQYVGGDTSLEAALRSRVNSVLNRIFKMPEYHIC
jgi:uncharacterized protein (DUF1800 family)